MLLDIGIPCFNESKYLRQCLESIDKQFVNNYSNIKVWVIDDDSMYSDEYQEIITHFTHHFTIQYKKMQKNSGPGICRNVVIEQGKAPWITFIDDDDFFISNPFPYLCSADMIRSEVYNTVGELHADLNSSFNCVLGTIFNREFIQEKQLLFSNDVGIVGTEDSVFLLLSLACTNSIQSAPSFITCSKRTNSNYTLQSSHEDGLGVDLLPLCNICAYIIKYKEYIIDKQIIWDVIKSYFITVLDSYEKNLSSLELKQYYTIMTHLTFFYCVLELFPSSADIKPYLNDDSTILPYLYCAYHFCTIENNTIYYQYKINNFIKPNNFLEPLSSEKAFLTLHLPSFRQGLIRYPCANMVKENRRSRNYPEKYWNF